MKEEVKILINVPIPPPCPVHNPVVPTLGDVIATEEEYAKSHYTLAHRELEQKLIAAGFTKHGWMLVGNGDGDQVWVELPWGHSLEEYIPLLKSVSEGCYLLFPDNGTDYIEPLFVCSGDVDREKVVGFLQPCCDKAKK